MEPIDTFEKIIYNSYYGKPYKSYDTYRKVVIERNRFLKQRSNRFDNILNRFFVEPDTTW